MSQIGNSATVPRTARSLVSRATPPLIAPFIRTAAADLHGLDSALYRAINQALRAGGL